MAASRSSSALLVVVVGLALATGGGLAAAQGFRTDAGATASLAAGAGGAGFTAGAAAAAETVAASAAGTFSAGEMGGVRLADDGTKADVTTIDEDAGGTTVAQLPPAGPAPQAAAGSASPILVSERAWADGTKTVVECTGDAARTCRVNVYGPDGEFILGRALTPTGEAADCGGPCLDATGAPLDSATVARAQAAVDAGAQTHKVVVSPGMALTPPPVPEAPTETEAEQLRHESQ